MKKADVIKRVNKVIMDNLGIFSEDELTPTANIFDDLGADGLDEVELCIALESEFDIVIPDAEWEACRSTVGGIRDYMVNKCAKQK